MSFSNPTQIGVIACPGGEQFADQVIPHLRNLFKRNFDRQANALSRRYKLNREDSRKQMNMTRDLLSKRPQLSNAPETYSPPKIKLPVEFTRFANGEVKAQIQTCVRGMDIYIFQDVENRYPITFKNSNDTICMSVNDHLLQLFVTVEAVRQAGAKTITLVLPAYPYSRQHKRKGRESLTASWFGHVCEFMSVDRIVTLDIHSKEIDNTFHSLSLENLHASYQIIKMLATLTDVKADDLVVVAPDSGSIDRNKFYAGNLQKPLAMLYKERDYSKVSKNANDNNITAAKLLGDVTGKTVFMADDMLGTGGTLIKAMKLLREMGAKKIICAISLPLFTGTAMESFDEAYKEGYFDYIIGTNAVYHNEVLLDRPWYKQADVSLLFAHFIHRLHHDKSTSPLLDNSRIIQKLLNSPDEKV